MAAPKGNEFWKLRSKHGRDRLFETPELLWEAACEYFQWCIDNPLEEEDWVGKDAKKVTRKKPRPFTMEGLCSYLDCNTAYFRQFKRSEVGKREDFSTTVTRIEETVYNQKFTYAAGGFFNANIIARDLGLVDKKEQQVIIEQPLFPDDEVPQDNSDKQA